MLKISCICSKSPKSLDIYNKITSLHNLSPIEDSDIIIVVGGDGELLHAIHKYMYLNKPFYPLNGGTIGFLTNEYSQDFLSKIPFSEISKLHPLEMNGENIYGEKFNALAVNEAYIFRTSHRAAKFSIMINDIVRMSELVADGAIS